MEQAKDSNDKNKILYITFSQDNKYFLIGTKEGCTLYQSDHCDKGLKLSKSIQFYNYNLISRKKR